MPHVRGCCITADDPGCATRFVVSECDTTRVEHQLMCAIAVSVQRDNALIMRTGYKRARSVQAKVETSTGRDGGSECVEASG